VIYFCCQNLKSASRRHEPNVPEELKSDAFLEYGLGQRWFLRDKNGQYTYAIYYCPWCGSRLPDSSS
jgi:hypothetical protein